jgi:hypothetical protein
MLNEYLTPKLLTSELSKRTWFLDTFEMKTDWKGGDLIVPFEGNPATSISVGELTASNDIAEADFVRGKVTTQPEVWYSLIFNQRDLAEHDGKIPESTFLDVMDRTMSSGMDFFKDQISYQFLGGPEVAVVSDDADAATGILTVDRIERLQKGQKVVLKDSDSNASYYITAIDLNTDKITLSSTRGGAAADVSAHTGTSPKLYLPGGTTSVFTSSKLALLSSTNGGSDTLHTKTKTDYPYLQAIQISGADITSSNIVERIFTHYVTIRRKNRGKAKKIVMSLKHWGSVMASQQILKGAYKVVGDPKKSEYGWWETTIASSTNGESLSIVAVPEFNDSEIWYCDPTSAKVFSNGGVKKHKTPDGNEFYVVRNTSGYQYIVDICFRGEAVWHAPANNGMLYAVSY